MTRYREIEKLCREQGIDVIFHEFPHRNDTVRLGMEWIMKENVCDACMFIPSDQPLLTEKSLEKIKVSYRLECDICRLSYEKTAGAPVLLEGHILKN